MSRNYSRLIYHVVFATKHRLSTIDPHVEQHVWALIAEACAYIDISVLKIGGIDDHVHLGIGIPPSISVGEAIGRIKGRSSRRISLEVPGMRGFGWQDGYSAFTVSWKRVDVLIEYIANQRSHHDES